MATMESRTLSVRIDRDIRDVYDFVSLPENFPRWATGLGASIAKVNDAWIAQTPHGPMTVRFTERNAFGVLDHYVGAAPLPCKIECEMALAPASCPVPLVRPAAPSLSCSMKLTWRQVVAVSATVLS